MTKLRFNYRLVSRNWLLGVCGAFALVLLAAAATVHGEGPANTSAEADDAIVARAEASVTVDAKLLELPVKVELLRDDKPVPRHEKIAAPAAAPAPLRAVRVMWMEVTAYCPCTKCCGPKAQGITASGKHVSYNNGGFVAADTDLLPFGTRLVIPGYHRDQPIEVIDRGGAIKGHKIDVFFDSHEAALEWGRQWVAVMIVE